jgi:hypothetical protein
MKNEISQQILDLKKLLNRLEMLNANPQIAGRKEMYDTAIAMDVQVQNIIFNTANYAE